MELLLSICIGTGLAAACGFRVFVPLLVISIASRSDYLELTSSFAWLETTPALSALAVATILELGAYYIPWLDNLLDGLTTPAAVIAGIVASASIATDMSPLLHWSTATIAGGGSAAAIQMGTTVTRQASFLMTGGLANPVVSTAEAGGAAVLSILAIIMPVIAVCLVILTFWFLARSARKIFARGPKAGHQLGASQPSSKT